MANNRSFDITQIVNTKIEQQKYTIEHAKQNIVTLDEAREPYYSAIRNIDTNLYQTIEDVNDTIVAVSSAYQERINVGCRTDMFWVQTGYTPAEPGGGGGGGGGIPEEWTYECIKITYVGYSTTHTLPSTGIALTTGDPIPTTYGYETDNFHGIKMYDEPYMEDLLSTYVGSGIGTIGAGSTALYILTPINSGGISNLKVGQIVQSSKQLVFSGNVNTIVAIGTTSKDLSNIPNSGVTTNSSIINVLFLENQAIQSVKAPENDGSFVTFTVLIDPNDIPDDYGVPFNSPPFTPQTVKMIGNSTINSTGVGNSVVYVNDGYPNVSKQWNQFLNGFQNPDDLRVGEVVSPPEVGAGLAYYRVGFTNAPAVYSGGSFNHLAVEGETITTEFPKGTLGSPVQDVSLSACPTQESELSSAISIRNNKESQFSSGISTFSSQINLTNAIRQDLSELNLRIWAYRMQIGKAQENLIQYNTFSEQINSPENQQIING
jgi:hypothetical protein